MPSVEVDLLEGRAGDDPAIEVSLAEALLAMIAAGERGPVLRCYRPLPTVAFGRRDAFLPGFRPAARAAADRGFAPVIRSAGGRAAAYDEGCLVFDEMLPAPDSLTGVRERFAGEAKRQAKALRGLGIDARVGEVPGEYCPGEFSVNARGRTKLIGSAQRIVGGAWLLSTLVVVRPQCGLRGVLEVVYAQLGLDWNPGTAGSIAEEAPGVGVDDVRRVLLDGYERRYRLAAAPVDARALSRARESVETHRVDA